jgi:hypothetical protein
MRHGASELLCCLRGHLLRRTSLANGSRPQMTVRHACTSLARLRAACAPTQCPARLHSPPTAARCFSNAVKPRPFRMAVIGSGPAAFYGAYRVMHRIEDAVVDMYEQLPVPYGLVRFGVAPDHPEVKVSDCEVVPAAGLTHTTELRG